MRIQLYMAIFLLLTYSCNKPDNFRPEVEYLTINDVRTDTLSSDTVFNQSFPIISEFKLTDNEGVEEYRFEFVKSADSLPDLRLIEVEAVGGVKEYIGNVSVNFDQSIIDSLPSYPLYYFITVDCFDKTGNVALQKKNIVEIIIN